MRHAVAPRMKYEMQKYISCGKYAIPNTNYMPTNGGDEKSQGLVKISQRLVKKGLMFFEKG